MPRLRLVTVVTAPLGSRLLSGAALSLAFPSYDLAPLAWVALALPLGMTTGRRTGEGAAIWFSFGVGFFGLLLIWISIVGWVAWALLVVLQAGFLAGFGALYARISRAGSVAALLLSAPVLWVAVEYVRAHVPVGGFTWGQLAQSQHGMTFMLKPAALGGGWMIALLIVRGERAGRACLDREAVIDAGGHGGRCGGRAPAGSAVAPGERCRIG